MNRAEKIRIRGALSEQRRVLSDRRTRLARHTEHRDAPLPADFAEQAVELENQETMVQLTQQSRDEIQAIDHALRRLDDGSYELCERCGNAIGAARLAAIPTAARCLQCAERE